MPHFKRWLDPFAALQELRAFLANRGRATRAVVTSWLGRVGRLRRKAKRARSSERDPRLEKAALELRPLDLRNPPSDNIASAALPLAATAAAVTAAAYLVASWQSQELAAGPVAERVGGSAYDTTPASAPALSFDADAGRWSGNGRLDAQLDPLEVPGLGATADELLHATASDGEGSTLNLPHEDWNPGKGGGAVGDRPPQNTQGESGAGSVGAPANPAPAVGNSASTPGSTNASGSNVLVPPSASTTGTATSGTSDGTPVAATTATVATSASSTAAAVAAPAGPAAAGASPTAIVNPPLLSDSSQQPVAFVQNAGQWAAGVDFEAQSNTYQTAISLAGMTVALPAGGTSGTVPTPMDAVSLNWTGTNPGSTAQGVGSLAAVSNFLIGNDPAQWHTGVAEYSSVQYANAWNGVNLVYTQGPSGQVEYNLVVQPGASAAAVGFTVQGASASIGAQGQLVLTTASGTQLIEQAPTLYQTAADGSRQAVTGGFAVRADGSIGFTVGAYDSSRALVIDPVLGYAATFGGSSVDVAKGVALDSSGNAYVVGYTDSSNFPVSTTAYDATFDGIKDAFVTKLGPTGSVVWSTYLGGSSFWSDAANAVALRSDGTIIVTGSTNQTDFPTTTGAYQTTIGGGTAGFSDAFLTALSASGSSLVYSTYLGGSGNDFGTALAIDPATNQVVVVGSTGPAFSGFGGGTDNFPTTAGAYQTTFGGGASNAFVSRLNATATSLVYSTYLGGSGTDAAYGVALDAAGNAFVVGQTSSSNFPTLYGYDTTLDGSTDAFVSKFTAGGGLEGSTLYGGSGNEAAYAVAVDPLGQIDVTGSTTSTDLPTVDPVQASYGGGASDAFVAQFTSLLYAPAYATYQGGSGADVGYGITADAADEPVVVGTDGTNLTLTRYTAAGTATNVSTSYSSATGFAVALNASGVIAVAGTNGSDAVALTYGPPATPAVTGGPTGVTNNTTPTVSGTAPAGSTVSVYGTSTATGATSLLGTATASGSGLWTYTLSAMSSDGTTVVTTTDTVSGAVSAVSAPLTVTLDTAAPTVTVAVVSQTYDRAPSVTVTASDLYGISPTATVALDIDYTGGGTYTNSVAVGTLVNDAYTFPESAFSTLLTVGVTASIRAEVTNLAGVTGVSTGMPVQVMTSPSTWTPTAYTFSPVPPGGGGGGGGGTGGGGGGGTGGGGGGGTGGTGGGTGGGGQGGGQGGPQIYPPVTGGGGGGGGGPGGGGGHPIFWPPPRRPSPLGDAGDVTDNEPLMLSSNQALDDGPAPGLEYNSQQADPAPVVQVEVQSDNALSAGPTAAVGTLTWDGTVVSTTNYNVSQLSPGALWIFSAEGPASAATGRHTYTLALAITNGIHGTQNVSYSGVTFVVNRSSSPYGAGWSFTGADDLVTIAASGSYPAGVMRLYGALYGEGGYSFYASNGSGGYISPAGDPGTLTTSGSGWLYTDYDGTTETFDSSGRMTTWTSADGTQTVTYTYTGAGSGTAAEVATVSNPDGSTATFTYSSGMLSTIVAPGSRTTTYTMSSGDLVTITDPTSVPATFTYSTHLLTGKTEEGATLAYTYVNASTITVKSGTDPVGTYTAAVAAGLSTAVKANAQGGVGGSYTDPRGNTTQTWYNSFGLPLEVLEPDQGIVINTYNTNNFLTSSTDELTRTTTYTVNANGQDTQITNPDTTSETWVYGGANSSLTKYTDALGNVWTYTNDSYGRQTSVTNPLNETTSTSYNASGPVTTTTNALGNVVTYSYDSALRQIGALSGGAVTGTTGYDTAGNATTFTDALGNVTTTTFNAVSNETGTIDPVNDRTTLTYSTTTGQLLSTTDADGNVTSYGYDASDRLVTTIAAYGTGLAEQTTTIYDADSDVVATIDALGNIDTTMYDANDRVTATEDALSNVTTMRLDLGDEVGATLDPLNRVTKDGYDLLGRLTTATDALKETTTTLYDADSNVTVMIDPLGNRTTNVYDAAGQLIATVDPLGDRTSYGYDAIGQQTTVTDPNGNVTTTAYDARGRVTAVTDALNHITTTAYDTRDLATAVTDALNHTTTTVYDADGRATVTIDALTNRTTTAYDKGGNVTAVTDALNHTTTTAYDANGNVTAVTDALGNTSTSVYDADNRVVATIDPLGNRSTTVYDPDGRVTVTEDALLNFTVTAYDAAGNAIAETDGRGDVTAYVLDGLNRVSITTDGAKDVSSVSYDAAGNVTTSTDALGKTTTTAYDAAGRATAVTDPLNHTTTTAYDKAGNATAVTDALNHTTTTTYDALNRATATQDALSLITTTAYDADSQVTAVTDPLSHTTTTAYDAVGQATTVTDPLNQTTTTAYDADGRVTAVTDPLSHTATTVYDADGQTTVAIDALGNRTTTAYDAAGNVTTVTDARNYVTTYGYNADNEQVTETDALSQVWTTAYNAVGQAWLSIDPLGDQTATYFDGDGRPVQTSDGLSDRESEAYNADGQVTATQDALHNVTNSLYDAAGRLTVTVDALGDRTSYGYDAVGNRTTLKDSDGNVTTWAYDADYRVTATTTPTGATTYAYDAASRVTSTTDPDGRRIDYTYDSDGQKLTEKWYAAGGTFLQTLTWTYDAAGNTLTAQAPAGSYTMNYDADDRVTAVAEPFALSLTFQYDADGDRTLVQDSQGGTTTTTFDALDRQTVQQLGGSGITGVKDTRAYDIAGRLVTDTRQTFTSGSWVTAGTTSYAYDPAGRETSITDFTGMGAVLASFTYAYDADNRVASETDDGVLRTFGYDATSQLVSDGGTAYSFDANGNRNSTGYATGTDNEVTTDGTSTYTYDAAGDVTRSTVGAAGATWTYTYDNRNELVGAVYSATLGGTITQQVTYVYDAFGNAIEEDYWNGSTTTVTRFGLDGWNPAQPAPVGNENFNDWADLNGSNALTMRRMFGPGVDEPTAREDSSGNVGWYLTDHLGNVRAITNGSGTLLTAIAYDGWGNVMSNSTPAQSDRYLTAGGQTDGATGLQFDGWRITNEKFFYQRDPIWPLGDPTNTYRFVGNDPTNATDPSGLQQNTPTLSVDKVIKEPLVGGLGSFIWPVSFNLNKKTATGGWIIQEIKQTFEAFNGKEDVSAKVFGKGASKHFYEAWEVKPEATSPAFAFADPKTGEALRDQWSAYVKVLAVRSINAGQPDDPTVKTNKDAAKDITDGKWNKTHDIFGTIWNQNEPDPTKYTSAIITTKSQVVFIEDPKLPDVMKMGNDPKGNKYNKNVLTLPNVSIDDPETGKPTEEGKKVTEWINANAEHRSNILKRTLTVTWDTDKNKIPKAETVGP